MQTGWRARGILGLAATWGVALSALATSALVIGLATGVVPDSIYGVRELAAVAIRGLLVGAISGGAFAWLLTMRERHETLSTLSSRRTALWGSIAAASVPLLIVVATGGPILPIGVLATSVAAFGVGGGIFASTLLRIARRQPKELSAPDQATRLR